VDETESLPISLLLHCVAAAAIFLYLERNIRRVLYVSLGFLGCALSLSSGPLMGLGVITAIFSYDRILKQNPWRWKALTPGHA
jgi:hypothetical protein